jgi:hypothetical protein
MYNQIRKKRSDRMWKVILKNTHTSVIVTLDGLMGRDRAEVEVAAMALIADPPSWTVALVDQLKPSPRTTDERQATRKAHTPHNQD